VLFINKPHDGKYTVTQPLSSSGKNQRTKEQGWDLEIDYFVKV